MSTLPNVARHLSLLLLVPSTCLAQDFAITAPAFLTAPGASSGEEFTLRGNLGVLSTVPLSAGAFVVEGTLLNVSTPMPVAASTRTVNGGLEDLSGTFSPAPDGTQSLPFPTAGTNLLPYGDAEGLASGDGKVSVPIPGWTVQGTLTITAWNQPDGWPLNTDPGPPDRGLNFFTGGFDGDSSTATTRVPLPADADAIDAGRVPYELSGWFGGFQGQSDTALLTASFLDAAGVLIESVRIGAPTAEQRLNRTGMIFDSILSTLPPGARQAEVVLEMKREATVGWNDGYADSLRLSLPDARTATLPGWSLLEGEVLWFSNTNALGPRSPYGELFLDLTGTRDAAPYGGISQSVATVPGEAYELRFALGTYEDLPSYRGPVSVIASAGTVTNTFTFSPETGGTGSLWQTFSLPFTATASSTVVSIVGLQSAGGAFLGLDHIAVEQADAREQPLLRIALPGGSLDVGTLELRFDSVAGRLYRLQRTDAVTGSAWQDVSGTDRVGDGGEVLLRVLVVPGTSSQFYRVRVGS